MLDAHNNRPIQSADLIKCPDHLQAVVRLQFIAVARGADRVGVTEQRR